MRWRFFIMFRIISIAVLFHFSLQCGASFAADPLSASAQADYASITDLANSAKALPAGSPERRTALTRLVTKCESFTVQYGEKLDALLLMAAGALETDDSLFGSLAGERIRALPAGNVSDADKQKAARVLALLTQKGWLAEGYLRKQLLTVAEGSDKTKARWASLWLGRCSELELGGKVDLAEASRWYEKSSQLGSTEATTALARLKSAATLRPAVTAAAVPPATPAISDSDRLLRANVMGAVADYRNAAKGGNAEASTGYLNEILKASATYLKNQPKDRDIWLIRALAALELNLASEGGEAGLRLKELGILQAGDDNALQIMSRIDRKGWMERVVMNARRSNGASPLDFPVKDINGKDAKLDQYKGKVVLIVNVASKSGNTPQYTGLESLYKKYATQGLVVIGFPANDFGQQEPGTNEEIKAFCSGNYNVTFPMMSKVAVVGEGKTPLYRFLTEKSTAGEFAGEITWNFTKFLVSRNGNVIGRWASKTTPDNKQVIEEIELALAGKLAQE
jgi:glutathione peroxidase